MNKSIFSIYLTMVIVCLPLNSMDSGRQFCFRRYARRSFIDENPASPNRPDFVINVAPVDYIEPDCRYCHRNSKAKIVYVCGVVSGFTLYCFTSRVFNYFLSEN